MTTEFTVVYLVCAFLIAFPKSETAKVDHSLAWPVERTTWWQVELTDSWQHGGDRFVERLVGSEAAVDQNGAKLSISGEADVRGTAD